MKTIQELMSLNGRVAVVTGGAGYLGAVMVEALAEAGADVVMLDCCRELCHQKAEELQGRYATRIIPLVVDLSNDEEVRAVPRQVLRRLGRLDILIHGAAFVGTSDLKGYAVPFEEQTIESWRKAMEVNLTAVFLLTQSCQKALAASRQGSVINIGSIYGMLGPDMSLYEGTGLGNPAAYSVSKGGIIQLTRWLATVMAPEVRVNAISPGGVYKGHTDPFLGRYERKVPLKRMASTQDFKGAVVYLASDLSAYVTGHNLVVDGGLSVW